MADLAKVATTAANKTSVIGDGISATNFRSSSVTVMSTEIGARTPDCFTRSPSKGSKKVIAPRSCLPPPPPRPPPNPQVAPPDGKTKSKRNLPPPPPPPTGSKKSLLSTQVDIGGTKQSESTVCVDAVDRHVLDCNHSSRTEDVINRNDEKSVSCMCTAQNETMKATKFYTVSARDRNIVSCSLGNQPLTSSSASMITVDINLDDQNGPTVTSPSTSQCTADGDSQQAKDKVIPKPKPRRHRPSAFVSVVGDVVATDNAPSQACDKTAETEESAQPSRLTDQGDVVNKGAVIQQRFKPLPPPKKPGVVKLLRTKINRSADDSSDDGLSPHRQDLSSETKPVPRLRRKHNLTKSQRVTEPPVDGCTDKTVASGFLTTGVTIRHEDNLTEGTIDGRPVSKRGRIPKMNSFTTEDLDIFQKTSADKCKLGDILDSSDCELHEDSAKKVRKPSVKRSKSAGMNFAGKNPTMAVKPQVAEKPKIPEKPVKNKRFCIIRPKDEVQPKDENSAKSEIDENLSATNAVQLSREAAKDDITETKPTARPHGKIPEAAPEKHSAKVSKKTKSKPVKVTSATKTMWFVGSVTESEDSEAERSADSGSVDSKHHLADDSCSMSSTTPTSLIRKTRPKPQISPKPSTSPTPTTPTTPTAPMTSPVQWTSPTQENTVYENIDDSHFYGNVEIKWNDAGQNDAIDQVGESDIPRADSDDLASNENIYEEVDIADDHKFRRCSLKRSRKKLSRSSHRVEEDEDLMFSDDDDYFDDDSFTDSDEEFNQELFNQLPVHSEPHEEEGEPKSKLEHIARELLSTEISYVNKLHLVDQVFHLHIVAENRRCRMFPDEVIPEMFSNIKSIYLFHHDNLLPQLKKRMAEWDSSNKIGDVMRRFAPFLKLYTEYVKNFDHAMNVITQWRDKSPKFAELLASLQQRPECERLTMQHHMLSPIQRVPRYELLLKDYLKSLPDDSSDREDSLEALHLVQTAANQSNEAMQKIEKFKKLLEINDSLIGISGIISPTRELIKEGKIMKISARSGYRLDRYLFLFNDLLLLCQSLPIVGIKQHYNVKAKLCMDGMQILEGDNMETPNTFYVKSKEKTLELHTSTMEEKTEWQVTLWNVIADYTKKTVSRKPWTKVTDEYSDNDLGKWPPIWIKDQHTTMCMLCSIGFNFRRRRHHCRACGHVVCGTCSTHKLVLRYDENRLNRVCEQCYNVLSGSSNHCISRPMGESLLSRHRKVLKVKGTDPSLLSGFLHVSSDKKTWQKRYYTIHDDFVMYSFKACQDVVAMTSTPLPGYLVSLVTEKDGISRDHVFKLFHGGMKKVYYFQADDKGLLMRWVSILEKVVNATLPTYNPTLEAGLDKIRTKSLPESNA